MANFGKRMVAEDLIKQIGQGGGGSDLNLQAGTGISITTGETADDKIIAVDETVIPNKSEVQSFAGNYTNTLRPEGTEIKTFIDSLPVFNLQFTTDIDTLPNEVKINLNQDDMNGNKIFGSGTFLVKDTANNTYILISTWNVTVSNYVNPSKTPTFKTFIIERTGNSSVGLSGARVGNYWRSTSYYTYNGSPCTVVYIAVTRAPESQINVSTATTMSNTMRETLPTIDATDPISAYNVSVPNNPTNTAWPTTAGRYALRTDLDNKDMPVYDWVEALPPCPVTTDGTYVLEATVSSGVVTYAWVLKV